MNMRTLRYGLLLIFLWGALSAARGADWMPVTDRNGAWRLARPLEWFVREMDQATMVSSPDGRANVVLHAEAARPGTVDEWFETLLPALREHLPGLNVLERRSSSVCGYPALFVRSENVNQGVLMHAGFLLVKGPLHQVLITCSCPKTDFPFAEPHFDRILKSLEILPQAQSQGPPPVPASLPSPPPTPDQVPSGKTASRPKPSVKPPTVQWEPYVSKYLTFTLQKPVGWTVEEEWKENPALVRFAVTGPGGLYRVFCTVAETAERNPDTLVRGVAAELARQLPDLRPAETARRKQVGSRTTFLLEGTYTGPGNQRRQFRSLVSGGDGTLLHQRLDAPEGALEQGAPVLLQILANLRMAKNVFPFDEGAANQGAPNRNPTPTLIPRTLAGGWGLFAAPESWRHTDLGRGRFIAVDASEQLYFVAATVDFVNPRYGNLARLPGVLVAQFMRPHQAFAFACTRQGLGSDFKFQVHDRPDLVQEMRLRFAGGRPCSVEDFAYTFRHKGRPYKGISMGHCIGDYMDAGYSLGHITVWAPADQFEGWLPTFGRMIASYELNRERVGAYIAEGLTRYYRGIGQLSRRIAANSEQMRRENLELHMERGRVGDYISYLTTRMIMGEYDYLAGASGYVRGDPSGLYTDSGQRITSEPYGESITRSMQEINSRPLFQALRP